MTKKFVPGRTYTHKYFFDVNIMVTSASRSFFKRHWTLGIVWVSKGGTVYYPDMIRVKSESLGDWTEC